MEIAMFNLQKHQSEYQYEGVTLIKNFIPEPTCSLIRAKVQQRINSNEIKLVDHDAQGTDKELDGGGRYLHHIFRTDDIKSHVPELVGAYHAALPLVSMVTSTNTVISPHEGSEINIKAYPKNGGTLGAHFDTNGITALIYLTDNTEGALVLRKKREHPEKGVWHEEERIYAESGMLLLMKGREIWHWSEPTANEEKIVVVMNYYQSGDTWRPAHFDQFVYEGENQNVFG